MTNKERLDALLKSYMSYTKTMWSSNDVEEIKDKCETFDNVYNNIFEDLEVLEIIKRNTRISKANSIRVYLSNSVYASEERASDYKKVKKWLENN